MGQEEDEMIKPKVTEATAKNIVWNLYGLKATSLKPLNGYDDKNFRIAVEKEHDNPHITSAPAENGYILKITNSLHSKNDDLFDGQCCMMLHLADKGFDMTKPIKNKQGQYKSLEDLDDYVDGEEARDGSGVKFMVRMLVYIDGKILDDLESWTTEHFYQCGQFVARMNNALQDFHHEVYKARTTDIWFMTSVPEVKKYVSCVKNPARQKIVQEILGKFEEEVEPVLQSGRLTTSIIHGDINEQNIIVRPKKGKGGNNVYDIHTVIDFGDTQKNPLVFELAIAIMYMMTRRHGTSTGGHVLAGYLTERELSEEEMGLLRVLVAARFTQSLVRGAYTYQQDPQNEYALTTAKNGGWEALEDFWKVPKDKLYEEWNKIIESYKN